MKPIARKDDLVIQEMGGEILVYDLRTNKAICLNQTSALVWQNCDGKKDALEIAESIEKQLGASVKEDLVWFAINQLKDERLLENGNNYSNKFENLPRREVIKKIGLSAMVALPIVASMTSPVAAGSGTCVGMCGVSLNCPAVTNCMCSNPTQPQNNGTCSIG
jgi:hypothetical protein